MIDPHTVLLPLLSPDPLADPFTDPLVERARAALSRQSSALGGVQLRVEEACTQLPSGSGSGWTGPAQDVYGFGLHELAEAVDRARESVRTALVATELALDSLAR